MKTFIADIFPRIQRFSQRIDNLTLLTNQHWVVLDELNQSKTVYIFRNNGELLIAINGFVEKAKWEYLGQNSILIDFKEGKSYLFRHGFFDENVLALKVDGKDEYAILINESKHKWELNSIDAVINFLKQNYIINPPGVRRVLGQSVRITITNISFQKIGYSIKMGSHKEYLVNFSNGKKIIIYQKISDLKYFIYGVENILIFPNKETCIKYIEEQIS
jgi:hypothetical protein